MDSHMKVKNICVVGGGISGLSVLHYLKKKYAGRTDIHIQLFEKNPYPGGTIQTIHEGGWLFECGPNGFLDSKLSILQLTRDLGLEDQLLPAGPQSRARFLFIHNRLHAIPTDFVSFWKFAPLSVLDKLRIPAELFTRRADHPDETVYEFGRRHFGENCTTTFLDALIQGIYAGDIRRLHLRSIFPKLYDLEQKYGSLLKALIHSRRENPLGVGGFVTFKKGMSQLVQRFHERYKDSILVNHEVSIVSQKKDGFIVHSNEKVYDADELFLCTPAGHASMITKSLNETLSAQLSKIPYVSIAVAGLIYKKAIFPQPPSGFGYLTPSSEKREVLGVLFDSQIFPQRSDPNVEQFRVMIGGAHHPQIISKPETEFLRMANNEIRSVFKLPQKEEPLHAFMAVWPKAIPQYNVEEVLTRRNIENEISKIKKFHIVSNYLGGISLNDCVRNAQAAAERSSLKDGKSY